MKVSEPPIIVEQKFDLPIGTIWKSITVVHEMKQWFFDNIPDFKAEVGFKTEFTVATENHTFPHLWEVTEVIPQQKIVYNWRYKNFQGDSYVTFELSKIDNNQTLLKLSTKIIEDFPDHIHEFKRESCLSGWNYFIKTSLVNYLNQ